MGKSDDKTNVCRVLDQKKVSYKTHVCPDAEGLSGDEIAAVSGSELLCCLHLP